MPYRCEAQIQLEEWPPPGHSPVGSPLVRFVWPLAGRRHPHLSEFIIWMSLPCIAMDFICLNLWFLQEVETVVSVVPQLMLGTEFGSYVSGPLR